MSDQIDTGYAEPPEQWIVAHQVQPTRCPTCGTVHLGAACEPAVARTGSHPHAARPGAMATVAESHGELVNRLHTAEARVSVLESQLAAIPWGAIWACANAIERTADEGEFRACEERAASIVLSLDINRPELADVIETGVARWRTVHKREYATQEDARE